jgi:hypothetical protein
MIGRELRAEYLRLMQLHNCRPFTREPLALVSPVAGPVVVEGICSSVDVDAERMSFARGSLHWAALDRVPLVLRHDVGRTAGKIRRLNYGADGKLHIEALVEDEIAKTMPAFSIAATVFESEARNVDSSMGFHFVITKARIDEISLTDKPSNGVALIHSRRSATAADDHADAILVGVERVRALLAELQATWSSDVENRGDIVTSAPEPEPVDQGNNVTLKEPPRPSRTLPPRIYGTLPRAVLAVRRTEMRDLIARLPSGG